MRSFLSTKKTKIDKRKNGMEIEIAKATILINVSHPEAL